MLAKAFSLETQQRAAGDHRYGQRQIAIYLGRLPPIAGKARNTNPSAKPIGHESYMTRNH